MKKIIFFLSFCALALTGLAQKVSFGEPPSEVTIGKAEVQTDTVWAVVNDTLQKAVMKQNKFVVIYHPTNKDLEGVEFYSTPTFYTGDRRVKVDMYYKPEPTLSISKTLHYRYGSDNKVFLNQN